MWVYQCKCIWINKYVTNDHGHSKFRIYVNRMEGLNWQNFNENISLHSQTSSSECPNNSNVPNSSYQQHLFDNMFHPTLQWLRIYTFHVSYNMILIIMSIPFVLASIVTAQRCHCTRVETKMENSGKQNLFFVRNDDTHMIMQTIGRKSCWSNLHALKDNKANMRDLIAATGLVITQIGFKSSIFSPCDLEIWWMTSKIIGHLFYTTSSFLHHFKSIRELKLELQSGNSQFQSKSASFCPGWPWN